MRAKHVVAFWLVPAPPKKQLFGALIRILARELKAPLFEPHITLFTSAMRPAEAREILEAIRAAPIRLAVDRVHYGGKFTKTLFVRFRDGARLGALIDEFQRTTGRRISRPADPHLSLCYKHLPTSAKRELAAIIRLPFKSVAFDVIKVVQGVSPTTTSKDVRGWRSLETCRFGR